MAYAFNKMDEYLRGRKSGQQLPGSQSIGKGPTLPAGGGMQASKGVPQSAGASTGRAILEKAGSEGVDESLNRILRPASQQATSMKTQIGEGGQNYFKKESENIASKFGVPQDVTGTVSRAATGDTEAANTLRQGMTIQPYTAPKPPEMAINALQPTEYLKAGNVGTYLQKTSGGRYTPGMGLIDAMQMQKNRAGAGVAQAIGDIQSGVRDAYKATEQYAPQLQDLAKTKQEETQAAIRQAIIDRQSIINQAIQDAIAKAQAEQSGIDTEEAKKAEASLAAIGKPADISKYMGRTETTRAFNTPEIGQYNTLAGILGGDLMTDPMITDVNYAPDEASLREWLARNTPAEPTPVETPATMLPDGTVASTVYPTGPIQGSPGGGLQQGGEPIVVQTGTPGGENVTPSEGWNPYPTTPPPPPPSSQPAPTEYEEGTDESIPEIGPRADEIPTGGAGQPSAAGSEGIVDVLGSAASLPAAGAIALGDVFADWGGWGASKGVEYDPISYGKGPTSGMKIQPVSIK